MVATSEFTITDEVHTAALWLITQEPRPANAVVALQEQFGLKPLGACQAIAEAERIRRNRQAH